MENLSNEMWKDIIGYEGLYMVSNLGRVKSLDRYVRNQHNSFSKRLVKGRLLKPFSSGAGYLMVCLSVSQIHKKEYVHRLVAKAFIGISDLTVHHKNDVKSDNRLSNLEYCTQKENCNKGNRNKIISEQKKMLEKNNLTRRNNKGQYLNKRHYNDKLT